MSPSQVTRRRYPARYRGRPGPYGTGEFYSGVTPGAIGEAEVTTYGTAPPMMSFRRPGCAWLAVYDPREIERYPSVLARWQVFAVTARALASATARAAADELAGLVRCPGCGRLGDPEYAGHGDGFPYATGAFTCPGCGARLRGARHWHDADPDRVCHCTRPGTYARI